MKKLHNLGKVLSKVEQKRILGGNYGGGGTCSEGKYWLCCTTPNGFEMWCRTECPANPTDECNAIYPAYDGKGVSGNCAPVVIIPA